MVQAGVAVKTLEYYADLARVHGLPTVDGNLPIPAVHTDFPLAALGEELGLVGVTAILGLFLVLIERGLRIAASAADEFRSLGVRSILNNSVSKRLKWMAWSINPYRGCEFGCRYCYARYTHEFMELRESVDFEDRIYAKSNVAEILRQELRLLKPGSAIAIGTATDPYQPAERRPRPVRGPRDHQLHPQRVDSGQGQAGNANRPAVIPNAEAELKDAFSSPARLMQTLRDKVATAGTFLAWSPTGTLVLMVFAAAATLVGLWPRLEEFL